MRRERVPSAEPKTPDDLKVGWLNPNNGEIERLLNTYQAAKILGLSLACLERYRWAGVGPRFIKIGPNGPVRYRTCDLLEWLEQQLQQGGRVA
jgi:predicted DNA-binding transcriptional regulator AlpA